MHACEAQRADTISARCLGVAQGPLWLPHFKLPKIASGCSCKVKVLSENWNLAPGYFNGKSAKDIIMLVDRNIFENLLPWICSYFKRLDFSKKSLDSKTHVPFKKFAFGMVNYIPLNGFRNVAKYPMILWNFWHCWEGGKSGRGARAGGGKSGRRARPFPGEAAGKTFSRGGSCPPWLCHCQKGEPVAWKKFLKIIKSFFAVASGPHCS